MRITFVLEVPSFPLPLQCLIRKERIPRYVYDGTFNR